MPKEVDRESSALVVLRELVAILDRHPAARQYARTAGLLEPLLPYLERRARSLIAEADAPRAVKS